MILRESVAKEKVVNTAPQYVGIANIMPLVWTYPVDLLHEVHIT